MVFYWKVLFKSLLRRTVLLSSVHFAHTTSFLSFTSPLLSSNASSSICRSALSFFSLNSLAYKKCRTKVNNEHCLNFQVIAFKAKQERGDAMVVYHLHGQFHFGQMVSKTHDWQLNFVPGSCLTFVQFSSFYQKRSQRP